jgi:hypothetical protein
MEAAPVERKLRRPPAPAPVSCDRDGMGKRTSPRYFGNSSLVKNDEAGKSVFSS